MFLDWLILDSLVLVDLSARVLVAAYWLFVVLMLATFTANLAGGTSWLTSDGTFTASFAALGATTGARRIAPLPPPAPPSSC